MKRNTNQHHGLVRGLLLFCLLTILPFSVHAQQKFFNLTAEDVKIDSLLPYFTHFQPLPAAYEDSIYTAEILYPEFRDMSDVDVERYHQITTDALPEMPEIRNLLLVDRKKGVLEISFVPLVERDGKMQKLVSFMLNIRATEKSGGSRKTDNVESRASSYSGRYAAHSVLSTGSWAKIRVSSTGVYQLTDELIRKAGFTDLSKVKIYGYGGALQNETLIGSYLQETDDLKEVPTCTVNGKRLFHATGTVTWNSSADPIRIRNPYSDYGYYFITQNDDEPLTVDSETFLNTYYPSNDDYHALHEIDNYSWYSGGRNLFENTPIEVGESKTYQLNVPVAEDGTNTGSFYVALTAGNNSVADVEINGVSVDTQTITLKEYDNGSSSFGIYEMDMKAENTIKITPTSGGPIRLDHISAAFTKAGWAKPDLENSSFNAPEYVYNITNQDLHADSAYQMVIIIPTSQQTRTQADRLAEFHRNHDGLSVKVVPADELFNEFSSGTPDANAYRRYLKMMYDRATTDEEMPRYLLLFGDCAWDNRMNTDTWKTLSPDDFLLCYESENSFNNVSCYVDDGFFCCLDDGEGSNPLTYDRPDVAVGRFPVHAATDAEVMVEKSISYIENANAGDWQNVVMFMGDDGNNNMHMKAADESAAYVESLNPGMLVKRVMWDTYERVTTSSGNSYPDATTIIKKQQEAGALIMDYYGHGGPHGLSHEYVLRTSDFQNFTNKNLPLWITASCEVMPFDGYIETLGEEAVLNKNGGAVAFFGTTRTVYTDKNEAINLAYLRALFTRVNGKFISIGEAQRVAKNYLVTSRQDRTVNKLQYSLLGDPALVLHIPTLNVVVDEINGNAVGSSAQTTLKAGSLATITGHVERNGETLSDYNGTVSAVVRDNSEQIVCRLNNTSYDGATEPFVYYDRTKTLFSGSNTLENGTFTITFAVPVDINYSNEEGMVNLYVLSNGSSETGNGSSTDFLVGGSDVLNNDSIGPSIYCYLNSPDFTNGGDVNPTPYFVAEINDKDGLNTSGNGIGHDLELIIDNNQLTTYVLNDNFTFDFGSYTTGRTYYNIPELSEGKHTLLFRAWDILNNSSTATLDFNVVRGLTPRCIDVNVTTNPAKSSTTFIVQHDRSGSNVEIILDIFDVSGRQLWSYTESGYSQSSSYTFDWDLTVDGGAKLQTGVYLYRVRIGSDGSQKASKAKKLVIIN